MMAIASVAVRNINKVNKVKSTSANNRNNSDNEKLGKRRCYVCFRKESKHVWFSVFGCCESMYYCSRTSQLKGWKQHQVVCEPISQLGTARKEKIHKTGIYNTILTLSERD